ncbi:MAG: UDP-N-acetylmuramate dehydrogenase [Patescibacteria group bacterium]
MLPKNFTTIKEGVLLKDFTTFRIGGPARFFVDVSTVEELTEALAFAKQEDVATLILGGGSNVLISDEGFDGLVIHPKFLGFEIQGESVHVASGENWDSVVKRCVEAGLWGIENLSLVPGDSGGFVMQNVGAYGQQASDVIESVAVYDIQNHQSSIINQQSCGFGYRKSIFNTTEKGRYVILSVDIKLAKNGKPKTEYPDVKKYLEEKKITNPTLQEMREVIIEIRTRKGFDPSTRWSAGSFFKNPILTPDQYKRVREKVAMKFGESMAIQLEELKNKFTRSSGEIKIPAGFLLDQLLHLKGMRIGGAELSDKQVISIYNRGNASAVDVLALYTEVCRLVRDATGITLIPEPEFVGIQEP